MTGILLGFILGVLSFIGYGAWRALRSDGWDDSNLLNWLRLLSHVYIHPEDFPKMWYVDHRGELVSRPFHYLENDELQGVVRSRPDANIR